MIERALRRLTLTAARITDRTCWLFVQIERRDGCVGTGEATLEGREEATVAAAARIAPALWSVDWDEGRAIMHAIAPSDLTDAAIASAVDMALWDLHAQDAQVRLVDALGGAHRSSVPLYANINRRTRDRSPAGFAQSARDALGAGFNALKIAPFDEVSTEKCASGSGASAIQAGIARIAAVREAAGPGRRVMVDCHWRFDEETAARMIDATADFALHWVECPLPESPATIPALVRLRDRGSKYGVRLAGMEQGIGYESFRPFCETGCYDVMMPDVKYVGGLREMLRCADEFTRHGVAMSPHNPSGPVSHVASLQLSAAMRSFDMLELQFDESPLFDDLVVGGCPKRIDGSSAVPQASGLGIRLAPEVLAACTERAPLILEAP